MLSPGHLSLSPFSEPPTRMHVLKVSIIVGVRGTLEKAGFGAMQDIVDQLKQKLSGSDELL